ncbi:hypothetical protein NDU88_008549 [Pleurodeles waltl]|uniref:Uncharacterized protein n=1 Tax=Pleurodeles waltl TaxID=8319 RepID=A0AAV7RX76_PLEWA|nr:hypothetical protein NDU88_008549 [Pleurodeles waltl]
MNLVKLSSRAHRKSTAEPEVPVGFGTDIGATLTQGPALKLQVCSWECPPCPLEMKGVTSVALSLVGPPLVVLLLRPTLGGELPVAAEQPLGLPAEGREVQPADGTRQGARGALVPEGARGAVLLHLRPTAASERPCTSAHRHHAHPGAGRARRRSLMLSGPLRAARALPWGSPGATDRRQAASQRNPCQRVHTIFKTAKHAPVRR